jgi:hypothetical protein
MPRQVRGLLIDDACIESSVVLKRGVGRGDELEGHGKLVAIKDPEQ